MVLLGELLDDGLVLADGSGEEFDDGVEEGLYTGISVVLLYIKKY